jgi:hypothetical protein
MSWSCQQRAYYGPKTISLFLLEDIGRAAKESRKGFRSDLQLLSFFRASYTSNCYSLAPHDFDFRSRFPFLSLKTGTLLGFSR